MYKRQVAGLSKERLGGTAQINLTAQGETLMVKDIAVSYTHLAKDCCIFQQQLSDDLCGDKPADYRTVLYLLCKIFQQRLFERYAVFAAQRILLHNEFYSSEHCRNHRTFCAGIFKEEKVPAVSDDYSGGVHLPQVCVDFDSIFLYQPDSVKQVGACSLFCCDSADLLQHR